MAINAQSQYNNVNGFIEFGGEEKPLLDTATTGRLSGGFRLIGQGLAETDSGMVSLEVDGLSGVVQLQTTNETEHTIGITTPKMFDVALMGTIICEARVRFVDLDTKQFYFGLTDVNEDVAILEGENLLGSTTTITLTASDLCGFLLSAELTDDEDWHMVFNGGVTTGETDSTAIDANDDAIAGEWQILRFEVDTNGTARWYIDGVLKQTTLAAVSTTVDLALLLMVEAKGNNVELMELDYIGYECTRDWNA